MRKIIAVIIVFFCIKVGAQNANPTFAVGGKLGPNFSTVVDNFDNASAKAGIHIGAVGVMGFGKNGNSTLVAELLFNQKGGKNQVSGNNNVLALDLPILYRYTMVIKQDFPLKAFFNVGPYVGATLSRKADNKTNQRIGEFGIAGGGGLFYPISIGTLFLEGRYAISLTNMVPATLERNRVTSISVGFIYALKGKSQEQIDKTIDGGFE
jgi:hypothetical protein